jgi:hypothetical protein
MDYFSILLLISSRLIFTFSDVNESSKELIAYLLIGSFLIIVFKDGWRIYIHEKVKDNEPILITPKEFNKIKSAAKTEDVYNGLCVLLAEFHMFHRKRVLEYDVNTGQNKQVELAEVKTEPKNADIVVQAVSSTSTGT